MYEAWFRFTHRPFPSAPQATRFFPAEEIDAAFKSIIGCVERGAGPAIVIGSTGIGKTTLALQLKQYFAATRPVALIAGSSCHSRRSLLQNALAACQLPYNESDEGSLRLAISEHLKSRAADGHSTVLIVDEADSLDEDLLDELRGLANLTIDSGWCLHLVLLGSSRLEERLGLPSLESLEQRIATRRYLGAWHRQDTEKYVRSQIQLAGIDAETIFDSAAIVKIQEITGGVPRVINQLCDHALALAGEKETKDIDSAAVEVAWADLQQLPLPTTAGDSTAEAVVPTESIIEFGSLEEPVGNSLKSDATTKPPSAELGVEPSLSTADNSFTELDARQGSINAISVGAAASLSAVAGSHGAQGAPADPQSIDDALVHFSNSAQDKIGGDKPANDFLGDQDHHGHKDDFDSFAQSIKLEAPEIEAENRDAARASYALTGEAGMAESPTMEPQVSPAETVERIGDFVSEMHEESYSSEASLEEISANEAPSSANPFLEQFDEEEVVIGRPEGLTQNQDLLVDSVETVEGRFLSEELQLNDMRQILPEELMSDIGSATLADETESTQASEATDHANLHSGDVSAPSLSPFDSPANEAPTFESPSVESQALHSQTWEIQTSASESSDPKENQENLANDSPDIGASFISAGDNDDDQSSDDRAELEDPSWAVVSGPATESDRSHEMSDFESQPALADDGLTANEPDCEVARTNPTSDSTADQSQTESGCSGFTADGAQPEPKNKHRRFGRLFSQLSKKR